jgi:hypothetical protein
LTAFFGTGAHSNSMAAHSALNEGERLFEEEVVSLGPMA